MAIMDALARFGENTATGSLTANTRKVFGDIIDQGDTYAEFGGGRQSTDAGDGSATYVNVIVTNSFDMSTSATLRFDVSHDDAVTSATPPGLTAPAQLASYTHTGDLNAGSQFSFFIPVGRKIERYMQMGVTASESRNSTQAGSFTAWIGIQPVETRIVYQEGRNWS